MLSKIFCENTNKNSELCIFAQIFKSYYDYEEDYKSMVQPSTV